MLAARHDDDDDDDLVWRDSKVDNFADFRFFVD